jgi:hypothetical protein
MASTKCYTVLGFLLCIQTQDECSERLTDRFFGNFYFTPASPELAEQADYTLRIRSEAEKPQTPTGLEKLTVTRGSCSLDGEKLYLEVDGAAIHIGSGEDSVICVYIGESELARQPEAFSNVLAYAAQAVLRRCKLFTLHAAGVVNPEGRGALIFGNANAGKSTLTVRLAAAGWRYLTDDTLILFETSEGVEAAAYRRAFAVADDVLALSQLPGLERRLNDSTTTDRRKRFLQPSTIFPEGFAETCVPQALFFASVTNSPESHVREISQAESMTRLLMLCPWASIDRAVARDHLRALGQLVKQSKSYELLGGRDILNEPERAAHLLSSVMK